MSDFQLFFIRFMRSNWDEVHPLFDGLGKYNWDKTHSLFDGKLDTFDLIHSEFRSAFIQSIEDLFSNHKEQ